MNITNEQPKESLEEEKDLAKNLAINSIKTADHFGIVNGITSPYNKPGVVKASPISGYIVVFLGADEKFTYRGEIIYTPKQ